MSRLKSILPIVTVIALALTGCASIESTSTGSGGGFLGSAYSVPKQIRYSYTLRNTSAKPITRASFQTYAPYPQTSHQKVVKVSANFPYQTVRDELGNERLAFEIPLVPPYGAVVVSVTADLLMAETGTTESVGNGRYVKPERYIESDDPRIATLAKTLSGATTAESTRKTYEWVADHLFTESFVAEDRGALYALLEKKGDCTEFAYLLTALYRAQGVPARPVAGYVFSGNDIVKAADYHNWTEFHDNGIWQIADAQKRLFRERQANFVTMRRIASDSTEKVTAQRFSFAGEGLDVTMN